ncbi:DUF3108 domain-containing protein [Membranicola marinus]|uniref:DUF3108 domain-containing protein n=1 Tax=Membranihabitans marinus TaxID=1227546 RepID=A0A953HS09_9BACT|nr:DUF3108 domain-containing protein [Membranihabitans marinus]MBY5956838.1 DUF3108 domain-containing protein [Membranihabitans marinus]
MRDFRSYFVLALLYFFLPKASIEDHPVSAVETGREVVEESTNDYCRVNNRTFRDGEVLTYKLYYNINFIWIGAGTVTFKINQWGNKYYAQAIGKTYGGYDWIFKVRDTFHSVLDASTLLPIQSTRIVNEGSYTKYDQVNYMRNSRLAESTMGKSRASAESKIITIDQCVHDILSTMYAFRNTPIESLASQNKFELDMLLDRKKYPITLTYKGADDQTKVKGVGSFDTYVFEPKLIAGNIFKEEGGMKIWVSRDRNKVPLIIESPISVGKVKAILIDHKNLRYETLGY